MKEDPPPLSASSEDEAALSISRSHRMTLARKQTAIIQLLKGEALDIVAREHTAHRFDLRRGKGTGVSIRKIRSWRSSLSIVNSPTLHFRREISLSRPSRGRDLGCEAQWNRKPG